MENTEGKKQTIDEYFEKTLSKEELEEVNKEYKGAKLLVKLKAELVLREQLENWVEAEQEQNEKLTIRVKELEGALEAERSIKVQAIKNKLKEIRKGAASLNGGWRPNQEHKRGVETAVKVLTDYIETLNT